jgi:hypothetical protein
VPILARVLISRGGTRPDPGLAAAVAVAIGSLLLAAPAPLASTGPTRSEYVNEVEPICKAETLAHKDALQGVEGMVKRGELKRAAPHVARAAAAFRGATRRIAAVPRPPADAARLARWLGFAKTGGKLLDQLAADLRRDDRAAVQRLAKELLREAKRANAVVVGFDFDYCRVDPGRFA